MNPGSGSETNHLPPSSLEPQSEDSGEESNGNSWWHLAEDVPFRIFGRTALHWAASSGDVETVRDLLKRGFDVNARSGNRRTPLHYAALEGHVEVIGELLAAGADVNLRDQLGMTPLTLSCRRLCPEERLSSVTKKLLSAGAHPHMRDSKRHSPIYYALKRGWYEGRHSARLILASCAFNDVAIDWENERTPCDTEFGIRVLSECEAEIRKMKETRVPDSRVTFFDVARRHPSRVAPRLGVRSIRRVEESDRLMIEFPIYGELIASKLQRVRERRVLADRCMEYFCRILPFPCVEAVILFLTNDDMRNCLRAVEPGTHGEDGGEMCSGLS